MSINLQIEVDDEVTPVLARLVESFTDLTEFHEDLADDLKDYTKFHIRDAAATRHKTANWLKKEPTNYLSLAAETVESSFDPVGVTLRVAGAIFKRVNGPVTIRPREKQYLTIPIHKEAAGRRAAEFAWRAPEPKGPRRKGKPRRLIWGLLLITSKKGNKLLVRRNQDGSFTPYYLLKTSVTLEQDTGLLPDGKQLGQVAERTAREYLGRKFREVG